MTPVGTPETGPPETGPAEARRASTGHASTGHGDRRRAGRVPRLDAFVAVVIAYLPFFLSSPGRVSSDTKQYLYLDPGAFLARIPWLWDSQVAAGTVSHQHIGYLFPMGPFYWLGEVVGLPDWVTQRLWLGTITLAALLGARWLFSQLGVRRSGANVGALVYGLSPYQLAFTARISVLLLPWAALPWLVGLTMRAARRGGWRDPAIFALVVLTVSGVNASAFLLVAIGPVIWIALELFGGRARARAAVTAALRILVLSLAVSPWWIAGIWAQGAYGLPVLQLTENVRTVATASSPGDILRGLGNWFFYGYDRGGRALVQAEAYLTTRSVVVASFLVPSVALFAGVMTRWRHRAYFAACVVVGTVVGVGAWPFDDTTRYGAWWKSFTNATSIGLALRNTPRVVPVVALGVAGLLAAGVAALSARMTRAVVGLGLVVAVAIALLPVWQDGFFTPSVERPNDVPAYWHDAIRALDRGSHATRILEIPGSSFATYRWGNTVEPITPGLTTRPYLAREVLPYGSPESVNLFDAFERRIQNGSFEPSTVAPLARIFGVGTVAVRSDLAYERSGAPHPRALWQKLTEPRPAGLARPRTFGSNTPNRATPSDGVDLRTPASVSDPPPVALFDVRSPVPIVRAAADRNPIVMSGDGDGVVDLAGAGLISGEERILELASLSPASLRHALHTGAALALTDSNRRRVTSYFSSIRDTKGATERAGQTTADVNGYSSDLDPLFHRSDATRSVVEQHGARVDANADEGADRAEDHAAKAFDGDVRTSWRVGGTDPLGAAITVRPYRAPRVDHIDIVQPLELPRDRWISRVRVAVDDAAPFEVDLGDASFTRQGQRITFPTTSVHRLTITIAGIHQPPFDPAFANAIGLAEVRLDHIRVRETVRLPVDLTDRVGGDASGHSLAIVMSRLRQDTATDGRLDEELTLDRRFALPDTRTFAVSGTARVNPDAGDPTIDTVLGTTVPGATFRASDHLHGDLGARASRAFDGQTSTAWTSAYGTQLGQWIETTATDPVTTDHLSFAALADADHTTPTRVDVVADGRVVARTNVSTPVVNGRRAVAVAFPPTTARRWRLVVTAVTPPTGVAATAPAQVPPVALDAITIPGIPAAPETGAIDRRCRTGLVTIDGAPVAIRLTGTDAEARSGVALDRCDGPLRLTRGSHTITTARGWDTAIDVDRLVLTSDPAGAPAAAGPLVTTDPSGTRLQVRNPSPSTVDITGRTDGKPFWLVLGQSHNRGWQARLDGHDLGAPTLVDGYANAWLVRPGHAGTVSLALEWTPQKFVWIALAVSIVGIVLCGLIILVTRRRRSAVDPA
ncbi:MAG: alpha-(1-_3)-arabinofuranosyltransferase family protein, partial [Acidimicrobiia bacterium]